MLVYSNHLGMPNDLNIYHDPGDKYPWTFGTVEGTYIFHTASELTQSLKRRGLLTREIEQAIKTEERNSITCT